MLDRARWFKRRVRKSRWRFGGVRAGDDFFSRPRGEVPGGRRKRSRRRAPRMLQTEGFDVAEDAWKRFTPEVVDPHKCQARVWGSGRGDQCSLRPLPGERLCCLHDRQSRGGAGLPHGCVTGEVPRPALVEFLRAALRREDKEIKRAGDEELVKAGAAPRGRRGKQLFYARYRMWYEAKNCGRAEEVHHLSDLTAAERRLCLERVHQHFRKHTGLQLRNGGFVEQGKGPRHDAALDDDAFAYNGSSPQRGRAFEWYRKAVFQDKLRQCGWTAERCTTAKDVFATATERQCMEALRRTSDALQRCPQVIALLEEYAGPQCYPQVAEEKRYRANAPPKAKDNADVPAMAVARQQLRCWLRCDACERWRLIERGAFAAVDPSAGSSNDRRSDGGDVLEDWGAWLNAAPGRFAAFRQRHARQRAAADAQEAAAAAERCGEADGLAPGVAPNGLDAGDAETCAVVRELQQASADAQQAAAAAERCGGGLTGLRPAWLPGSRAPMARQRVLLFPTALKPQPKSALAAQACIRPCAPARTTTTTAQRGSFARCFASSARGVVA